MESTSEQEPAEKQHQAARASVSENGAMTETCCRLFGVYLELNEAVPLRSGMLEQGVDRIVAQVVDPKINHIFRPQVERVVREFLSPGSCSEEPLPPMPAAEIKPESCIPEQGTHHFYIVFNSHALSTFTPL